MSDKTIKPPVYFALVQANFHAVSAMDRYVSDIQDEFRKNGYPQFEIVPIMQVQFQAAAQVHEPQVVHSSSWLFTDIDGSAGFILGHNSLTYRTTCYETKEDFIQGLLTGLNIVDKALTLGHINRLGIRYLNAIIPASPEESIKDYLVDGLHGIGLVNAIGDLKQSLIESTYDTNTGPLITKGTLINRVYQMTSLLGYPVDMQPTGLLPSPAFSMSEPRSHAIIDLDHIVEGKMAIDINLIEQQLNNMNNTLEQVLCASLTPKAQQIIGN